MSHPFPPEEFGPIGAMLAEQLIGDWRPDEATRRLILEKVGETLVYCQMDRMEDQYQGVEGLNKYIDEIIMQWLHGTVTMMLWMITKHEQERT